MDDRDQLIDSHVERLSTAALLWIQNTLHEQTQQFGVGLPSQDMAIEVARRAQQSLVVSYMNQARKMSMPALLAGAHWDPNPEGDEAKWGAVLALSRP